MAAELSAGELDKRVTLIRPTLSEFEDETTGWETIAVVWAAVEVGSGGEATGAERTVSSQVVTVKIRYRADVDPRCRVLDGAHTYRIVSLADVSRRKAQLVLSCTEVI